AALYRFDFERAAVMLEADTTYTRALAARAHAQLSERNRLAADSLLRVAVARRNAGDASDLDVELARVNTGQAANVAAADSLELISTLLDLQAVLGIVADGPRLTPVDSPTLPPLDSLVALLDATLPVLAGASA